MNRAKRTAWLVVLGLLLGGLLMVVLVNPTRTTADERQERMEVAGSPLEADQSLTQTFYANHDGLSGVELVVARFSQALLPVEAIITFEVYAEGQSTPLRSVSLQADTLEHNEHLRVSWEPIADSASNAYTLSISTPEDLSMGFWQTQTEAYAYGGIQQGDTILSGDLWFVTYYDYNWLDALSDAFTVTGRWLPYLAALLLVLFAPGWALTHLLGLNAHQSLYGRLYLIAALSMIFWPLLILWSGTLSLNAGGAVVWVLVALLVVWAILQRPRQRSLRLRFGTPELVMTVVMILIVLARLHDIRNVVLPLWVDSVHHSVITDIISHLGGVPTTYEPYMPVGNFHYHFGFHSLCAALTWFSDLPSEQAVLLMGQVMNIMAPLAAYYLAEQLTCSRWTGVLAAVVTGALSYLPAYLVTWGRYTELAGLVLLPAVLLLTRSALDRPRRLLPAALATASLCLVHYRVFVLYLLALPFLLLAKKNLGARAGRLLATGLTGALLILPWILRFALAVLPTAGTTYGSWSPVSGSNAFSTGLITSYWFGTLLWIALAAVVVAVLNRRWAMVGLGLWGGLWLLAANLRWIGLPDTWFLDNPAVMIALWLPVAVLDAWLGVYLLQWLYRVIPWRSSRTYAAATLTVVSLMLTCLGLWHHLDIINPVTVLTEPEDLQALEWAGENTPEDSLFLVNSMTWQGTIHAGSDAGWWLPLVAQRDTTLPCILYHQDDGSYRDAVNALANAVENAPSPDDPELLALLQEAGVTHVFVGTKAGPMQPAELDYSENYTAIYVSGPVRIYAFTPVSP